MLQPTRSYNAGNQYRYGFNGKENDNEIKGEGNQQDYGMRIYDLRLGRFLSVDPLTSLYPWYTPYQFAGNMPIWAIDVDGLEPETSTESNPKELEGATVTAKKPNEAATRSAERYGVSGGTGGAAAYTYHVNEYYHRGSETYRTKGGWYDEEQYVGLLSKNSFWGGNSPGLDLANAGVSPLPPAAANKNREEIDDRLKDFYGEIGDPEPIFFTIMGVAANQAAGNRSRAVSGLCEPSPFNVEDFVGVGLLVKGFFKALINTTVKEEGFNVVSAFKNAISSYKGGDLTNAGRAVTKHPEYFGFESTEALMKVYRTKGSINNLGSTTLKNIIRNGVRTKGAGGRYPNGWVTYTLSNGQAASWNLNGTFIGFRGKK